MLGIELQNKTIVFLSDGITMGYAVNKSNNRYADIAAKEPVSFSKAP